MKSYLKLCVTALLILTVSLVRGQVAPHVPLALGSIAPNTLEITYDKTSHIIFPAGIRYVDLGSDYLVAGKAEDSGNVLRVKAATKGFVSETNFSVITDDGQFYSFNACYADYPQQLSYNLVSLQQKTDRLQSADVLFNELGASKPAVADLLMQALDKKNKRAIRNIASESFGIRFSIRGIYIYDGKYYFQAAIENASNVPYTIDFINFKVVDKKRLKRTVVQEKPLDILKSFRPTDVVQGKASLTNIFLLDVFTLSEGQLLTIEVVDKNGGRSQLVKVKNFQLLKAELLSNLHLKF